MTAPELRGRRGETRPRILGVVRALALTLAVSAVVRELRMPRDERTWHGRVAGFVPYDFRVPTLERSRSRLWSPEDGRVLMPTVFGVGWTLNLGRLAALARSALARRPRE